MKEIDWSIAPEGATHWAPETDKSHECWYKKRGNGWMVSSKGTGYEWREISFPKRNLSELIPRPADPTAKDHRHEQPAWTGTGLPPVGTVCEMWHEKIGDWLKAEVAFAGEKILVVRYHSIAHGHHEAAIMNLDSEKLLRLPRTPEQIAAEEREKAVDEMMAVHEPWIATRRFCEKLYDAGYRRQEPQE